jgi:serine/threonine protein kinase
MAISPTRWKRFAESRYPHEREALEFLADGLPDSDPILLYSNFEFIADDGSVNEIDALVITSAGVFVLEIKSLGGIVQGNRHIWDWEKDGHTITIDSPLVLVNSKAKKLAGLIEKQKAFRGERRPYFEALVFLSAPGISVRLPDAERMRICEREPRDKKPGIIPALRRREYFGGITAPGMTIDHPAARRVARALDEAGIKPSQRQRRVADYVLQDLIEENPLFAYQDFHAEHPTTHALRRVRLYTVAGAGKEHRESVRSGALQEFRILEGLDHPGILRALDFHEHDLGPAILFRREPGEVRLDHFLRQHGASLSLDIKLDLSRQIADAVRYAHSHRVIHRALSPKSILVVQPDSGKPQIRIFNWQAGRLLATGSSSGSPASRSTTLHPSQYSEESALVYLAPEAVLNPRGRDPMADVFSLGAISYHILSGKPPAASALELTQILAEHKGLPLGAALDGAAQEIQDLIRKSTSPDLLLRTESAVAFLTGLDEVEEELTRPPSEPELDPLDAKKGDLLRHDLRVVKRLGGGSSAMALLVERNDEQMVLKVARRSDDNDRVAAEFRTLQKLRHPLIVSTKDKDLLEFQGNRRGFLMEYAGRGTLAQDLKDLGRLSLEYLQRYGEDLLQVVKYLEEEGVAHRDLKPDNIGIREYAKKNHLIVFDFSLSNAPIDQIRAGTPPYLEPFLQLPGRRKWDTAAERYAAAVILYEMATGTTPRWGDGQSAPHLIAGEVKIEHDLLEAPVRDALTTFFRKALKRDPQKRFDNAEDMWLSWHNAFSSAAITESSGPDLVTQDKALDDLRPDMLISQIGLSTRAQNTLDRLEILTVRDLAAEQPGRFGNLRGVGNKTRREIMYLIGKVREKLPQPAIPDRAKVEADASGEGQVAPLSVDALTAQLISTSSSPAGKTSRQLLAQFLELEEAAAEVPIYPTQSQVAERTLRTRAQIGQIVTEGRKRWRRNPDLTAVRNEFEGFLKAEGGVVEVNELARFLLTSRGSEASEGMAKRRAAAVVRAALETEKVWERIRFIERRARGLFLIALTEEPYGEAALDYVETLADAAEKLANAEPLPSPARVLETLRSVPCPIPALRGDRMVRLAATVARVAVSPRLEVYPKRLDSLRALKLAQSALAGQTKLTPEELRTRVRERYPDAAELPGRPQLDDMLKEVGLALDWNEAAREYLAPEPPATESSISLQRQDTLVSPAVFVPPIEIPREVEEAQSFEHKLQAAYRAPSYLVLATEPKWDYLQMAQKSLSRHYPMAIFHCERELISAMRSEAINKRIRWEVILRADASPPESRDWENLSRLAGQAARMIAEKLRQRQESTLVIFPGLLARYGQLSILDELQDSLGNSSLWVLAGSEGRGGHPHSEKQAIPARPTQWAWIPPEWLGNGFRRYTGART